MAYDTKVIAGPCVITWNSVTWFSQGDVTVNFSRELSHFSASHVGRFDSRHKQAKITVSFTPVGRAAEIAGALMSLDGLVPGNSLVPGGSGAELPLVVSPVFNAGGASRVWTFPRAGITGIGDFTVSANKTQAGQITFTCLESLASAGTFFTSVSWSAAPTELGDFDPATVYTLPCRLIWATNPASLASGDYQLHATEGWTIGFSLGVNEHYREGFGLADVLLSDYTITVSGQAANWYDYAGALVAEQSITAAMPLSTKPGQRATRKVLQMKTLVADATSGSTVSSSTLLWEFPAAELNTAALAWGANANRTGNVQFTITPTFTSGVRSVASLDTQA